MRAAAEHLSYAIREFPAGGRPGLRDALIKRLADVRRAVGALRIQVNKPGADVLIDGSSIWLTPLPGEVFVDRATTLSRCGSKATRLRRRP